MAGDVGEIFVFFQKDFTLELQESSTTSSVCAREKESEKEKEKEL
jgi:hypothetical protein